MKSSGRSSDRASDQYAHRRGGRGKEYAMIAQVAHMYYELDMLQPEIAEKMFYSRSKVSRMLTQAKKLGIVKINVKRIVDRVPTLEKKLCDVFGLKKAVVISCFDDWNSPQAFESLTDYAALHISEMLQGELQIGVTNGRTLNSIVNKLHQIHSCELTVVQLMGTASNTYLDREAILHVSKLLSTFSNSREEDEAGTLSELDSFSKGFFLNAPLYIENNEARQALLHDPLIREVFDQMPHCDMLLTSVGELIEKSPPVSKSRYPVNWYGYQSEADVRELKEKGAVGSICALYYDINGQRVPCKWNENCIVMPFEEIRKNPMTICVASGENKVDSILGALRGKLLNELITDMHTASNLLERQEVLSKQASEQI